MNSAGGAPPWADVPDVDARAAKRPVADHADRPAAGPAAGSVPQAADGAKTWWLAAQPAEGTAGDGGPALLVMSGPGRQRRIPIPPGGLVLGRDHRLGSPLSTDTLVSREHASVRLCDDGSVEVTDLSSTNGTFLNAAKITAPTRMEAHDVLRVGDVELRLALARSGAPGRQDTVVGRRGQPDSSVSGPGPGAEDLLARARDLYELHRYEEARLVFLELASVPGAAAEAQYGLAMISLSLGDPAAAEAQLQHAAGLDPAHANALYELGALREQAHQIADAIAYYRRAVRVSPHHVSALAALGRLDTHISPPPPSSDQPAHGHPGPLPPPNLSADGIPSVYQFLLEDPTPISQQTVQLIHRVECEARPRYAAYVGRYFARTLRVTVILAIVLVLINVVSSMLRAHSSSGSPAASTVSRIDAVLGVCIVVLPVCLAVIGYIRVKCTYIRIQKGRLQIEKGVFHKHLNNIDFWRVHNIDLDRRLINRLTGDGTLVFSLTFGILPENYQRRRRRTKPNQVVEVCGIAQDAKLAELHQDLLNLTFLLRGNPTVKGIIQ